MTSRTDIEDMTDAQDEALHHVVAPWPTESILRIGGLVDIRSDGSITYGPDYSPDEAAKVLWDAIARMGLAHLARPSQAGDESVARIAGRAEGWAEAARFLETIKGADLDGREFNLPANEWRITALMGVRACADKLAALAAMDTPKGGGDGWQPIETAPKDGKHCILAIKSGPFVYSVEGCYHDGKWISAAEFDGEPLCWMSKTPIPDAFLPWTEAFKERALPAPPAAMKDGG